MLWCPKTTPHQRAHDLSKEVHRIGFHFPSVIVSAVCAHYGIVLSAAGTLITEDNAESFRQRRRNDRVGNSDDTKDQVTINTEARDAIKDLFPNIPDNDLHQIIKTAFQKGQKRVGTANELPLVRRAQLSVVAHVRHIYTSYDRLLKTVGYNEARGKVEEPTLRKLVEWRGDDDETGKQVLEDVFREVIVISDAEESDDDIEDDRARDQETRIELISGTADHGPIELMPINYAQQLSPDGHEPNNYSEDDAPRGYRYIPQVARRRTTTKQTSVAHQASSRYDAWDRARAQYRADPNNISRAPLTKGPPQNEPVFFQPPHPVSGDSFRRQSGAFDPSPKATFAPDSRRFEVS